MIDSNILVYENYKETKILFPSEYLEAYKGSLLEEELFLEMNQLLAPDSSAQIKGEFFNYLITLNPIGHWLDFNYLELNIDSISREDFLEERRERLDLFYLGELDLSNNFSSILILVKDGVENQYQIIRNLLLINISGSKVSSITRLSEYHLFEGVSGFSYSKRSSMDDFSVFQDLLSTDVICSDDHIVDEKCPIEFQYDSDGYLEFKVIND